MKFEYDKRFYGIKMTHEEDSYFNVDSRLLFQLGEKLVANRAVALAELVKNSYDADATNVTVRMYNIKSLGGTIYIEDNGSGMTLQDFKKSWMRIATGDKENSPISKIYKRQKSGEKGIGRFACRRLAKRLIIKSVAETEEWKEELSATFNWDTFTPGSDVDKIPVKSFTKKVEENTPTGTTLILENTRDSWDGRNIQRLRNELTELMSPLTFSLELDDPKTPKDYDPGFSLDFDCPEFPTKEERLDKTFFDNAWAKLCGSVDNSGVATYRIHVMNKIVNTIDRTFRREESFKFLRNSNLEIYFFTYKSELFNNTEWKMTQIQAIGRDRGGIKVYVDRFRVFGYGDKGDDWLKLDQDRARSRIGVDTEVRFLAEDDTRPGLLLFRNNSLFGHVSISKQNNPAFEITVNRDRLLENDAFGELRKFVRLGVDYATVLYSNEVSKEKILEKEIEEKIEEEEEKIRIKIKEEAKKAEEEAKKAEEEAKKVEEERRKVEEEAKKAEEERRKAEKQRRKAEEVRRKVEQKARISRGEAIKHLAAKALEEERKSLEFEEKVKKEEEEKRKKAEEERKKAEKEKEAAEIIKKQKENERKKAEEELRKLEEEKLQRKEKKYEIEFSQLRVLAASGTLVLTFGHELQALVQDMEEINYSFSSLVKELSPEKEKIYHEIMERFSYRTEMIKEFSQFFGLMAGRESRLKEHKWVIHPIVENVFSPFKLYFNEYGIEYLNKVPPYLKTPRMYRSELVSILHNLMTNSFKAVKGQKERLIEVNGFIDENETVHIQYLDSGIGISKELREEVFEPFASFSEPDLKFGVGTGLGLKIVRDIVRSYKGDIRFIDAPHGWNTCVEVILPEGI